MSSAPHHGRLFNRLARALIALSATLALLVAAGGAYAFTRYHEAQTIGVDPGVFGGDDHPDVGGPCVNDICNYLLLGSDSRSGLSQSQQGQFGTNGQAGTGKNADTIMLVHTDPNLQKAIILSFPRDLWVHIPGHGYDKINASYQGGPTLVAETIHQLTGLKINHYLYVNLAGFEGIVNTLGGVYMCIGAENVNTSDGRITDPLTGLDVKPGCQTLNGLQALAYVRTRHLRCDSAAPDFFRIARQQQFMRDVLTRMLQPQELAKASDLITPLLSNMTRDKKLNPADLISLVGQLRGITTGAAEFRAVPGYPAVVDGSDIIRMDPSAKQIFAAIRDGKPIGNVGTHLLNTPPSPANIQVSVVDRASGGKAAGVERVLAASGFDSSPGVISPAELGVSVPGNVIAFSPGHDVEARVVQGYFPSLEVKEVKGLGVGVAIVVGPSYAPTPLGATTTPPDCISPIP
ncbi:MAG: LCP family protein [Actinomycetota bacterium]|nr:LCP family protein [Actinomycetota bacterium]